MLFSLVSSLAASVVQASLVTYPGMGSLSDLLSHADRVRRAAHFRAPYGRKERSC